MAMPPGPPPGGPPEGSAPPQMPVDQAQALIAKLGIPKEALPMLAQAMDSLEAAGVIPADGDEGGPAPKSDPIGDAINAATAQHGMPQ